MHASMCSNAPCQFITCTFNQKSEAISVFLRASSRAHVSLFSFLGLNCTFTIAPAQFLTVTSSHKKNQRKEVQSRLSAAERCSVECRPFPFMLNGRVGRGEFPALRLSLARGRQASTLRCLRETSSFFPKWNLRSSKEHSRGCADPDIACHATPLLDVKLRHFAVGRRAKLTTNSPLFPPPKVTISSVQIFPAGA